MPARTITLDELTAQLRAAYGDALRALVLYGPAARVPAPVGVPLELLVVADVLDLDALRRLAPTVRAWREAGHPAPLALTAGEWRDSADVFPIEYAEVLASHRVLAGVLPLDGIAVEPAELRRQLRHRALGVLLQVRAGVLSAGNDARQQLDVLARSWPAVVAVLRALARLHGADAHAGGADAGRGLVAWAARVVGCEPVAFERVHAHVCGAVRLAPSGATGAAGGYLAALERVVAHVGPR